MTSQESHDFVPPRTFFLGLFLLGAVIGGVLIVAAAPLWAFYAASLVAMPPLVVHLRRSR